MRKVSILLAISMIFGLVACGGGGGGTTEVSNPPLLVLATAAQGTVTNISDYPVEGSTDPGATITVNGSLVSVDVNGEFATKVSLVPGSNVITVVANLSGKQATVQRTITLDQSSPSLTVTEPSASTTVTNQSSVLVSGTTDTEIFVAQLNGLDVPVVSGTFSTTVSLLNGPNALYISVEDVAGNTSEILKLVTMDQDAPVLAIIDPADGALLYASPFTLIGITELNCQVEVNGTLVALDSGGYFSSNISAVEGSNDLIIKSTDLAGNSASISITVGYYPSRIWYVNSNAPGLTEDGYSWTTAFSHPQQAIEVSKSGDQVWVARNSYTYSLPDFEQVLTMKSGVDLYGGFEGTENLFSERNLSSGLTTLDGGGVSYHVVIGANSATIDGFAITGGNANGTGNNANGGGLFNDSASPSVSNCLFISNNAVNGGAMYNTGSFSYIFSTLFELNTAGQGGALYNAGHSSPWLVKTTFNTNTASNHGGAVYNDNTQPHFENSSFNGSNASYGGAIFNANQSNSHVSSCTFYGNSSNNGGAVYLTDSGMKIIGTTFTLNTSLNSGGGIHAYNGILSVVSSDFLNNQATNVSGGAIYANTSDCKVLSSFFESNWAIEGGAITASGPSSPIIVNSIFVRNVAQHYGAGISGSFDSNNSTWTDINIINSTFTQNVGGGSGYSGGAVFLDQNTRAIIRNSILWGDVWGGDMSTPVELYEQSNAEFDVQYSDIDGGYAGTGNIYQNPLFNSSTDFSLQSGSPCIDAGNNSSLPSSTTTDYAGNNRIVDGDAANAAEVDMGGYEYQP